MDKKEKQNKHKIKRKEQNKKMEKTQESEKIRVYIKVNDYKINNVGTKQNNEISCIDNNDNETQVIYNLENHSLTRDNKDIKITLDFKNKKAEYDLKQENKSLVSDLEVKKLTKKGKLLNIIYIHNEETFNLKITYS